MKNSSPWPEELDTVFEEDQSASIQLETDEEDHLEALFIQTSLMKLNAEHHGSVIERDTTYKVNDCRMPLVNAVIKDGKGHGEVNAQCLFLTESRKYKLFFKYHVTSVPTSAEECKCVVFDKDFTFLKVMSIYIPKANNIL